MTVIGDKYRITVLTDRLIRLEYSEDASFEDRKSFAVINRDFPEVSVDKRQEGDLLILETSELKLVYDQKVFSSYGLSIELKTFGSKWNYNDNFNDFRNLKGTARTLDEVDGRRSLEAGLFGMDGYAILDDSKSPVMEGEEFVVRQSENTDIYFFGYGNDYYGALRDFFKLSGETPMIPRYALGNWWSRYYKYTEDSYMEVVENFKKEGIPLSVAVIDMDWHLTDIDPKYGSGWTGYTWDKNLFPDYKRFLKKLKDEKLSVTLNLHPADGIRAFEDMYEDVATAMGMDPKKELPVEFDFADKKFRDVYFDKVIHPYEKDGVDFWWIDWQQGTGKKKDDVDPLNLLNHFHYLDQENRNIRPMIFSRFAGAGSHRYPIGFSGDTVTTWKSLEFQPYFTSTASNIGFGWWSHDIGGHMYGDKDLERLIRWIQQGVFSPIMRIHSSSSPFFNKEPWTLPEPYRAITKKFMLLRHQLIPYLYTENYRAHSEGRPLIRPMYYEYSSCPESFDVNNQYIFGENLIAMAVTEPEDKELKMAGVRGIIPEGRWMDILTGVVYEGKKVRKFYRDLSDMPVLIPAGGIVPMAAESSENGCDNPARMEILVGGGKNGEYELYEDDGISMDFESGRFVKTMLKTSYDESSKTMEFTIGQPKGDVSLIPANRSYTLKVFGVEAGGYDKDPVTGALLIELCEGAVSESRTVRIENVTLKENDYKTLVFDIIEKAWTTIHIKESVYNKLNDLDKKDFTAWIRLSDIPENLKDAIMEVLGQ